MREDLGPGRCPSGWCAADDLGGRRWSERGNLRRVLGLQESRWGGALALAAMIVAFGSYGVWAELVDSSRERLALGVTLVVSLMHFWYDGFIWSVRRGEV